MLPRRSDSTTRYALMTATALLALGLGGCSAVAAPVITPTSATAGASSRMQAPTSGAPASTRPTGSFSAAEVEQAFRTAHFYAAISQNTRPFLSGTWDKQDQPKAVFNKYFKPYVTAELLVKLDKRLGQSSKDNSEILKFVLYGNASTKQLTVCPTDVKQCQLDNYPRFTNYRASAVDSSRIRVRLDVTNMLRITYKNKPQILPIDTEINVTLKRNPAYGSDASVLPFLIASTQNAVDIKQPHT